MDHSQHAGALDHPKTFDEVIAKGFPRDNLRALKKPHEARARATTGPGAPKLTLGAASAITRKEAGSAFSPAEQTAFMNAVIRLVQEGKYQELIGHHLDMSHNMHGSMGEIGLYRFLGWHRRYLLTFEREIQRVDRILRPMVTEKLGVPYWRWQDPFPAWMSGFLPAPDPSTGASPRPRKNASPPSKANAVDVDIIVNQFNIQSPGIPGTNDYTKFTYGLEGWGRRPDGSPLPAHNHIHAWVGGIMNNTLTSPTDPVFWLHHAEVDRLWHIWRQSHPTPGPLLTGADRIMDPWSETYDDLLDITALGYAYDSISL